MTRKILLGLTAALMLTLAGSGQTGTFKIVRATDVTVVATVPSTCPPGRIFIKTGSSSGLYVCIARNTPVASGSGGVGVGALNVVSATVAGPGTSVVVDATATPALSTLNLTSSNIGSALFNCFTGTGATKTAVGISSYTYTAATPIATLTVTLASSSSNAYCTVNSNGGAGAAGANGSNGANGATWSQGSGVPSDGSGNNGDFYFRTATSDVYQKASGTWGSPIANIKGATGSTGAAGSNGSNGSNGTNGNSVLNGSGAPSSGTGNNGDFYIDTSATVIYGPKSGGAWGSGTSLIGSGGSGGFVYTGVLSGIPGTCTQGQTAFITDAVVGRNQYNCTTANTWIQSSQATVPGSGVSSSSDPTTGIQTLSTDSTIVPRYFTAVAASIPATCTQGRDFFTATDTHVQSGCSQTNTWTALNNTLPANHGTSHTVSQPSEVYVCTSTCTMTLPVPSEGSPQFCVQNDDNVSTVITLAAIVGVQFENVARTSYKTANTAIASAGAVLDQICVVGRDATHYNVWAKTGTWN